jgi:hypothetical protein
MDQFVLDESPDDAGHLVAVHLDDRIVHFDLRHLREHLLRAGTGDGRTGMPAASTTLKIRLRREGRRRHPSLRAKRTIQRRLLDCFVAEPVIGPRFARTRWLLAMTTADE